MLLSCHKADTVQADYQPRPARDAISHMDVGKHGQREIDGLLRGIDLESKTMVMRVENGMDQTFQWDEGTTVTGGPSPQDNTIAQMKDLATRAGSELTVEWRDEGSQRIATAIDVKDISKKATPKARRKLNVVR